MMNRMNRINVNQKRLGLSLNQLKTLMIIKMFLMMMISIIQQYLRNILLLTSKYDNTKLVPLDALGIQYEPILDDNKWKIDMTMELIDAKWGRADIENLSTAEIDEVLEYICTSQMFLSPPSLFRGFSPGPPVFPQAIYLIIITVMLCKLHLLLQV